MTIEQIDFLSGFLASFGGSIIGSLLAQYHLDRRAAKKAKLLNK
jgi:hypothetical protein